MAVTDAPVRDELIRGSTWEGRSRALVRLYALQGSRPDFEPGSNAHRGVHGWVDRARLVEALEVAYPEYGYVPADLYYLLDEHAMERNGACVRLSEAGQRMAQSLLSSSAV